MADLHRLATSDLVLLSYIDPQDNDLLPINNDDNFGRALKTAKPLLRLIVQRKGECEVEYEQRNGTAHRVNSAEMINRWGLVQYNNY